jgi:hypothetical protein
LFVSMPIALSFHRCHALSRMHIVFLSQAIARRCGACPTQWMATRSSQPRTTAGSTPSRCK